MRGGSCVSCLIHEKEYFLGLIEFVKFEGDTLTNVGRKLDGEGSAITMTGRLKTGC
jgi:hypothetical protein